eukprot:2605623-Prymnesium_polylepis.1
MRALDIERFRARVVAIEFSSFFYAGERCTTRYRPDYVWNWRGSVTTGASLYLLDEMMRCRGYQFVGQVAGEHAIWVLRSELHPADLARPEPLPTAVLEGWQHLKRIHQHQKRLSAIKKNWKRSPRFANVSWADPTAGGHTSAAVPVPLFMTCNVSREARCVGD